MDERHTSLKDLQMQCEKYLGQALAIDHTRDAFNEAVDTLSSDVHSILEKALAHNLVDIESLSTSREHTTDSLLALQNKAMPLPTDHFENLNSIVRTVLKYAKQANLAPQSKQTNSSTITPEQV
jgi:hypothetical protein